MFKVAVTAPYSIYIWDDEDLTGEVFELPKLKRRPCTLHQLRLKYPKPYWAEFWKTMYISFGGRGCRRTLPTMSARPTRRSRHSV